mgnify:CR=1 FL=1
MDELELYNILYEKSHESWRPTIEYAKDDIIHATKMINKYKDNFCPDKELIARPFELTPLDKVNVVIVDHEPCCKVVNDEKISNGLAFSTHKQFQVQDTLKMIYKELSREYPDYKIPTHGDLTYWAEQGVLLLNTCFTVKPKIPFTHCKKDTGSGIWSGVVDKIINKVVTTNSECIYILWGNYASNLLYKVNEVSTKLSAGHPLSKNPKRDAIPFTDCNHFRLTNEQLVKLGKKEIDWQIPE